jgi:NDP-sugar pyrophosphorylase family protein
VILPVAILAGGLATRLRPLTDEVPKSLVEVAGRPFAEHQLELLRRNGITNAVFCVGHLGSQIEAVIGDGARFGLRVTYVDDGPSLLGTGGALRRARPALGDAFLVMYGDSYLDCDYRAISAAFVESGKQGLMTVFRNDNRWEQSNVRFEDGRILAYEKGARQTPMAHVDYGLGALRSEALERYPADQRLDLERVYRDLLAEGELAAFEVHERFYEIGSFSGLAEIRAKLTRESVN